jgi:hypothetical protein
VLFVHSQSFTPICTHIRLALPYPRQVGALALAKAMWERTWGANEIDNACCESARAGGGMSAPAEEFKINLNQNLWGLVVGLGSLGAAEHFALETLYCFSVVVSVVMVFSVAATTVAYTINYVRKRA